jgi:hypothetical protein
VPVCIDFLPDGRLLVVSGGEGRLLRREPDGSLGTHADGKTLFMVAADFASVLSGGELTREVLAVRAPPASAEWQRPAPQR